MRPGLAITGVLCAALATAATVTTSSLRTQLADSARTPSGPYRAGSGPLSPAPLPPLAASTTAVVSLEDGLLTIAADKVRLRDIMERVREATGAKLDAPALDQLVTVHLGPQPPAQVIAALLRGVRVSYIIKSSADSGKIQDIEVMRAPSLPGPGVPRPAGDVDPGLAAQADAAGTKALLFGQTGGDEGVWDNVNVGTLLNPVASSQD